MGIETLKLKKKLGKAKPHAEKKQGIWNQNRADLLIFPILFSSSSSNKLLTQQKLLHLTLQY
jgi:hypothetical protein